MEITKKKVQELLLCYHQLKTCQNRKKKEKEKEIHSSGIDLNRLHDLLVPEIQRMSKSVSNGIING